MTTGASRWWVKTVNSTGPKQDVVVAPVEGDGWLARAMGPRPGLLTSGRQSRGEGWKVADVREEEGWCGKLLVLPGDPDLVGAIPRQREDVVHKDRSF